MTDAASRYHVFRQHNGRGWGILRLIRLGSDEAVVIAAYLDEDDARAQLRALRAEESGAAS